MDEMLTAYIEAALWSSLDDNEKPLDENYDLEDISKSCLAKMREDVADFLQECRDLIGDDFAQAGHDFWLTRNGHGAGFWDGDWPEEDGKKLTSVSKGYGSFDLYVGDDGLIYCL